MGVVLDGTRVRAYVCDGTPGRVVTLADWFTGQLHDGSLDAVSRQHRVDLVAQVGGRIATGMITLADGRVVRFTAVLSARKDLIGVFQSTGHARGCSYHAGRLVLPDGDQRGAVVFPAGQVKGQADAMIYLPLGPIKVR